MLTSRLLVPFSVVALLHGFGHARGSEETLLYTYSHPLSATPWFESFSVPTLSPSQGVLQSVVIRCEARSSARFFVENLGANPSTVSASLSLQTNIVGPYDGGALLLSSAISSPLNTPVLAAFDGNLDFAGPSGLTLPTLESHQSALLSLAPGDPFFAAHIGSGYLRFSAAAEGSLAVAAGPSAVLSDLQAGVDLTITYTYRRIDCNSNGVPDAQDLSSGTSLDCDGNQFPDECQHDHDGDHVPDSCDPQCLAPGPDVDGDGIRDLCDTIPDCDSNQIPDAFEIDRNNNGIKDTCEFSGDCNLNGLPDALDIAAGLSDDFDQNDVPDECQTTSAGFYQGCQCQPQSGCEALPNSSGLPALLAVAGSCRVGENQFALQASRLPPYRQALFFQGALGAPAFVGLGIRCIASPMSRLGIVGADAQGQARFDVDLAHLAGSGAIRAWDSRAFQVAFRDVGPAGPSIHFSETVFLRFCP